jgi:Mg-chelatase subunit ChlD
MTLPSASLTEPAYLALLALAPAAWWVARRSMADLAPRRAQLALGLRLVILLLIVISLAGPQITLPSDRLAVLFLLDRSLSIPAAAREAQIRLVNEAAASMGARDTAGVVVFGRDAAMEVELEARPRLRGIHSLPADGFRDDTDIAAALRLALAALPNDARRRVVLVSDGNENLGDAAREAAAAGAAGAPVDVVPIDYRDDREALLDRLQAPTQARIGEPVEVIVTAVSTRGGPAALRLQCDGRPVSPRRAVHLRPGRNPFAFPVTLAQPGLHTFTAQIEPAPGSDAHPENNTALGFTRVQGRPRVLLVGAGEDTRYLDAALKSHRIAVTVAAPGRLPVNPADLESFESLVLANVAAHQLVPGQLQAIASSVRDLGGGLVMVGGPGSFGPGGYAGTPVEAVLPVELEVRRRREDPRLALVLVLDRSGSMGGPGEEGSKLEYARAAAQGAFASLRPGDEVGVLAFATTPEWVVPVGKLGSAPRTPPELDGLGAGGGTNLYPALVAARDALGGSQCAVKHVVLLTDGQTEGGDFEGIARQLARNRITLSTVGVGPDAEGRLLARLAELGAGRYYPAVRSAALRVIFDRETRLARRDALVEEPFTPRLAGPSPALAGLAPFPPLLGYVATTARGAPGAQLHLVSHRGDPILASWRVGLGKAVAFTSDARNRWGAPWVSGWGGRFGRFWAQVIRSTLRGPAAGDLVLGVRLEPPVGLVTAEVVDSEGNLVNQLELQGTVVAGADQQPLVLEQTAPGRYEGRFAAAGRGQYLVSVAYRDARGVHRVQTAGAAIAYSPEYRDLESDRALLVRLAELSGGHVHPPLGSAALRRDYGALFRHDGRAESAPRELWPLLLLAALLLFPLDVAARRLALTPSEALAWLRRGWARRRAGRRSPLAHPAAAPFHARLLAAKQLAEGRGPGRARAQAPAEQADLPAAAPGPAGARPPTGAPEAAGPPPAPAGAAPPGTAPAEPGHTRRLLAAKRRARGGP